MATPPAPSTCSPTHPETKINPLDTPAEQLQPFLDAFAVQLHYNLPDNSIRIEATISAEPYPT